MTEYKFTRADVGCYLEGAHGWHNIYRVVELAQAAGFELNDSDAACVSAYARQQDSVTMPWGEVANADAIADAMQEISNDATDYLQSVTEPGLVWEWDAGELSLVIDDEDEPQGGVITFSRPVVLTDDMARPVRYEDEED